MMIRFFGKAVLTLVVGLFLVAGSARAATMYVTDTFEITMRATPGVGRKIVAMLPSNTSVQTGERQDGWVLVSTAQGKKGWVLERYLTSETPSAFRVRELTADNETLKQSLQEATAELDRLKAEKVELSGSLDSTGAEFNELQSAYQQLRDEAAGYMELKSRHEQVSAELERASSVIEELRTENAVLRGKQRYRWFFTGGGMVLFTLLLGFWFGRIRRRQSSRISL
jgi:SH3 domain protein